MITNQASFLCFSSWGGWWLEGRIWLQVLQAPRAQDPTLFCDISDIVFEHCVGGPVCTCEHTCWPLPHPSYLENKFKIYFYIFKYIYNINIKYIQNIYKVKYNKIYFKYPIHLEIYFKRAGLKEILVKLWAEPFMRNHKMGFWESSSHIPSDMWEFFLCWWLRNQAFQRSLHLLESQEL